MGYIIQPAEALRLLEDSEDKYGGHAYLKHIKISNDELMLRFHRGDGAKDGETHWLSAFLTRRDAGEAAAQTLKKAASGQVGRVATGEIKEYAFEAETDWGFGARFSFGGGVRSFTTTRMRMVIRTIAAPRPSRFYIHTFYPRPPDAFDPSMKPGPKG